MLDLGAMEVKPQETVEQRAELTERVRSELDEPQWSVVSFDRHEAGGLTYFEAVETMSRLNADRVSGLCIVTDEAARRMSR